MTTDTKPMTVENKDTWRPRSRPDRGFRPVARGTPFG